LEALHSPDLRLLSFLGRQQGLALKVAKLLAAHGTCQAVLVQAAERLSSAQTSLFEAEMETQQLLADFPPPPPPPSLAELLVVQPVGSAGPVAARDLDLDSSGDESMGLEATVALKRAAPASAAAASKNRKTRQDLLLSQMVAAHVRADEAVAAPVAASSSLADLVGSRSPTDPLVVEMRARVEALEAAADVALQVANVAQAAVR
jgi:hypothetical protein